MFEPIGWLTLRFYGYGWLWGRRHYYYHGGQYVTHDLLFGNGNPILFGLGLFSIIAHALLIIFIFTAIGA
jgi:hypothetical protein